MFGFTQRAALVTFTLLAGACAYGPRPEQGPRSASPDVYQQSFEWRRLHGSGQYLSEQDFAAARSLSLAELFRLRFLRFQMPADALDSPVRNPTLPAIASTCPTQVYVNGSLAPAAVEGNLRPSDLFGAEYYTTTAAPSQFVRAWKNCPVLLLWLKR